MDYKQILGNILSDGNVSSRDRSMLGRYRKIHFITDKVHQQTVQSFGWTLEEFNQGWKSEENVAPKVERRHINRNPKEYSSNLHYRVATIMDKYNLLDEKPEIKLRTVDILEDMTS